MVPVGDPRLKGMNETQWLFELEAMNLQESERYEEIKAISESVRKQVISMLGLNLIPVEDEKTGLLRHPEEHECIPLVLLIGRDEVLATIKSKQEEFAVQRDVQAQLKAEDPILGTPDLSGEMTPEELDAFMKDDGDIEFENSAEDIMKSMNWGGKGAQVLLENLVLAKDDLDVDPLVEKKVRTIGQLRKDLKPGRGNIPEQEAVELEEVDLGPKPASTRPHVKQAVVLETK